MHENVYGLYKGISPCFICAAIVDAMHHLQIAVELSFMQSMTALQADIADGVNKGPPRFQMTVAYVLLQMIAVAIIVSRVCLATNAELVCVCACECVHVRCQRCASKAKA